ncbi:HAD family hydrolase [Notoacmeibacter sp. MSK16QG-6]|uniref:HAD family hydrolase n=1 Tax=Notoacmeibacter sp. MSK16QG-6 TaxID=2957982 RepID=UPI0020A13509|nr:HAD family hydrolase [Notoacmeibacter sp. MSK16QG-6]MCP1197805.1 HAD family hydrolase [Notoacmeibacter sp. MSK16QG-6]
MPTSRFDLILFDLDGVILDSRSNMERAWRAVQNEHELTTPFEAYFAEIGRPFADIMARLGLADRAAAIETTFRRSSTETISQTEFYDGMADVLSRISGSSVKAGIVTSKDEIRARLVLERLDCHFDIVLTPRADLRGKPAPDALLYAMALLHTDPVHTVFVGDMKSDHEAAKRAGIAYAHVDWGYGDPVDDDRHRLSEPQMLLTLLGLD